MEEDMKTGLKLALAAGIGLGALGIGGKSVSAFPISGLDPALATPADMATSVDQVRWVCRHCRWVHGWHRGWYRRYWCGPGFDVRYRYGYGYYSWRTMGGYWPYRYGYYC
jgi:hypothetical protein